jgi:hypothetical protein
MLRRHWLVGIFCASLGTSIGCQGSFESADGNDTNAGSNVAGSPSLRALRWGIWGHRLTGTGGAAAGSSGAAGAAPVTGTGGATGGQSGGTSGTVSPATGGATGSQSGGTSGTTSPATGGATGSQSGGTPGTGGSTSVPGTGGTPSAQGTGGAAVTATGGSTGGAGTCGNGTLDPGESCDGTALQSATCAQLGFSGGALACSSSCQFDVSSCTGGTIKPTVVASRTSCTAPCSVFFDAKTTAGLAGGAGGTGGIAGGDYVQANWNWDFNDPTSPHKGTIGFIAAHVFDNPGTYRVTTRVRDMAGNAGSTSTTITVSAMTGTTYYVSASGSDSNNGTSTSTPFLTYAHAMTFAGTNVTIKFRNGDRFALPTGTTNTIAVTGPFLLTGYNDPNAPSNVAPILSSADTSSFVTVFYLNGGSDQRITDIHVMGAGSGAGFQIFNTTGAPTTLFERVEIEGYDQSDGGNGWGFGANQTNQAVVDCYAHDFVGYGVYADRSQNLAIIGTRILNFHTDHAFRLQGGGSGGGTLGQFTNNSYVAENTVSALDNFSAGGLFRGENSNFVYVNNTANRTIGIAPQNTGVVEHVEYGLAEGNTLSRTDLNVGYVCFLVIANTVTLRNNVCVNADQFASMPNQANMPANWIDRIFVYNNTDYFTGSTGTVTFRNNIFWTGSTSTGSAIYSPGTATVVTDHNDLFSPNSTLSAPLVGTGGILTNPQFMSTTVGAPNAFRLQSGSPAQNTAAAVPLYQNSAGVTRPAASDMGAY